MICNFKMFNFCAFLLKKKENFNIFIKNKNYILITNYIFLQQECHKFKYLKNRG